jgi:hypothetical protein
MRNLNVGVDGGSADLFVLKPCRGADCQPCDTPDLGPIVRQRPLVSPLAVAIVTHP